MPCGPMTLTVLQRFLSSVGHRQPTQMSAVGVRLMAGVAGGQCSGFPRSVGLRLLTARARRTGRWMTVALTRVRAFLLRCLVTIVSCACVFPLANFRVSTTAFVQPFSSSKWRSNEVELTRSLGFDGAGRRGCGSSVGAG
eukprot:2475166-Rhodomonas_salina.2